VLYFGRKAERAGKYRVPIVRAVDFAAYNAPLLTTPTLSAPRGFTWRDPLAPILMDGTVGSIASQALKPGVPG